MTESIYSNYYFESTIDNFTNTDLDTIQLSEIFDSFQQKKEWPKSTNIYCYWDSHPFTCTPISIPTKFVIA